MKTAGGVKKRSEKSVAAVPSARPAEKIFPLIAGLWIGLTLLKFGNPVVLESRITPPTNLAQYLIFSWPLQWGYVVVGLVVLASFPILRPAIRKSHWPIALLGFWLFWQFLSSTRTVEKSLTTITLIHFVSCGVAFLLGWWALARTRLNALFWVPIFVAMFYVLYTGFDQRHGSLDAMRKEFFAQPNWQLYPKEYILKMQTNRIWSTLVYPNALAGVLLFFLPITAWIMAELTARWPRVARGVLLGFYGYLGLACLYWTGSKGGWLIALGLTGLVVLHLNFPRKLKIALISAGLLLGLAAFFIRFSDYFQRGATSVGARFDYWTAAAKTARDNPILGTGPGTFWEAYRKIKPPDAEPARLAHNDYLEQASDSGFIGALAYIAFMGLSLWKLYPKCATRGWEYLLIWFALLAWAAQAVIEFPLYIPALAWPAFLFLGWLWALPDPGDLKQQ